MSGIRNVSSSSHINRTENVQKKTSTQNSKSTKQGKTENLKISALNDKTLQKHIKRRIHSLNLETTDDLQKARRILIEDSLIWGLGESVIEDPKFSQMVQNIESQFCQNRSQQQKVNRLLKKLMS